MRKIMIVEDDPAIREELALLLENEGYQALVVTDFGDVPGQAGTFGPDLVLLDLGLPGRDGFSLCAELRRRCPVPIVVVTSRNSAADELRALSLGGDDYITKPFDSKEMAARVKAVLRRTMGQTEEEEETADDTLSFPGLTVSLSRYEVFYEGKKLEMPPKELEVLYFLASHVNQLFTRGQLLDQVWGFQVEVESRTVDVHVKRLRDKLVGCEKYGWRIQTIWGRGYKFEVIK